MTEHTTGQSAMQAEERSVPSDSMAHLGTGEDIQCTVIKDDVDRCNND